RAVIIRRVVQRAGARQRRIRGIGRARREHRDHEPRRHGEHGPHHAILAPSDALLQFAPMTDPVVVPRAEHAISRKQVDPDALKVLYRLHQNNYAAYLVGGSVRDLLLGRRPKDFDIGTNAHPYQVKRLFRNCWIIGRRFRLAHVRFGPKTIEVATFRRQLTAEELAAPEEPPDEGIPLEPGPGHHDRMLHRDNTFGTPEEDAFRRDFTVNALFYDIAAFS